MGTETKLTKAVESQLQKHLEAIDVIKNDMVNRAVDLGRELVAVRDLIPGPFLEWVKDNCRFSRSTAYRYIDAFEALGSFPKLGHFDESALYVLVRHDEALAEAKRLANKGFRIGHAKAVELVDQFVDANKKPQQPTRGPEAPAGRIGTSGSTSQDSNGAAPLDDDDDANDVEADQSAAARPFAYLPSLPPDVSDAFESFKLSILRHKLSGWDAISLDDVLQTLDSLKQMAKAPQ